jgi:hypothetical protein
MPSIRTSWRWFAPRREIAEGHDDGSANAYSRMFVVGGLLGSGGASTSALHQLKTLIFPRNTSHTRRVDEHTIVASKIVHESVDFSLLNEIDMWKLRWPSGTTG